MGKKVLLIAAIFLLFKAEFTYSQIIVTEAGLSFANGEKFMIVENNKTAAEIINHITTAIKSKHQSPNIKIEVQDDLILITDFISNYTKTDKAAGSAYMLDLSYKFVINVRDNRFRINIPTFEISAGQKYDSHAVVVNQGVQFLMTMEMKGKNAVWNNRHKKLFIYNEKGKLVEQSTKDKLEHDFSSIIKIITEQEEADW